VEEPSPNAAGDDTQLNMLAYNISIKVREVTRVSSGPPPSPSPSPSSNRGDRWSRHDSRRQYDSSHSNGRSVNLPDHGRDGNGAPPPSSRFQGQPRHRQVIDISSSASSGSSSAPSSRPPAASSAASAAPASSTAPSPRRRRRGKKGRKRTTATCQSPDKSLQRWVVKSVGLTSAAAREAAAISNEPPAASHVDPPPLSLADPMLSQHTTSPPTPTTNHSMPATHHQNMQPPLLPQDTTTLCCSDPHPDPPPVQFLVGSVLLSTAVGPSPITETAAGPPPLPRWDTSPETSSTHAPILDMVIPESAPPDPPASPAAPPSALEDKQLSLAPTPTPARRHLHFGSPSWTVYSRQSRNPSTPDSPTPTPSADHCSRAAKLKMLTSPAKHLLPRPTVQKTRRKVIPDNFIPRRSKRVQARGAARTEGPSRSCTKAILLKLGICVEDDDRAAPSPAALARYEQQFRRIMGRNQIAALASLYGWDLPSDDELAAQTSAANNPLVVTGRSRR
jgi:hypothetical protein